MLIWLYSSSLQSHPARIHPAWFEDIRQLPFGSHPNRDNASTEDQIRKGTCQASHHRLIPIDINVCEATWVIDRRGLLHKSMMS
jgi:hypothetical protein